MKPWINALIIFVTVLICYYQSLGHGFVWDDNIYVVKNEAVHDWSRAAEAFASPRTTWSSNPTYNISEWRPLRNISYLIDYSLFELNPIGWHLHNILLHGLGGVLLYFLLRRLCRMFLQEPVKQGTVELACLMGALFWAVHPLQTEVVAWVKSRDDLLATPLFFGVLLLALPRSPERSSAGPAALVTAIVLYVSALLSKENVVVLAAILPMLLFAMAFGWFREEDPVASGGDGETSTSAPGQERKRRLRAAFWVSFVFGLITLAGLAGRDVMLGRTAQASHPGGLFDTVLTMAAAFAKYMRLVLWPWWPTVQSADYDGFPVVRSWLAPLSLSGIAMLAAMIALADAARKRAPLVSLGIAFFLVAMVPFANIIPMMQIMAERFLYLPLAGAAITVTGLVILAGQAEVEVRRLLIAGASLVIAALLLQTQLRLPVWESELKLFEATHRANPDSWRPADQYVKALLRDGQTTAALQKARHNLAVWQNDPDIVRTAAVAYMLAGYEDAGTSLTAWAVALQPDDYRASQTLEIWRRSRNSAE